MSYTLIVHQVADYPAWKIVFDRAAEIRKAAGERSFQVLRDHADPNLVVHHSEWTSVADAKAFFESPELIKIREEAGVEAPRFLYLEELESGTL